MNKLFSKLTVPAQHFEYMEEIAQIECIRQLLTGIDFRKITGGVSSEKLLKEQL